jgi:DNA processing protein
VATEALVGPLSEAEKRFCPPRIFVAGDGGLLRCTRRVAVVGARDASHEGLRRAARLARELVQDSVIVVSGLARGIDTAAHEAAIETGGRTIAVLGTPFDNVSPKSNLALFRIIARDHLAVTEFAPGSTIRRGNFPRRNRVMALLSDATVIIEASDTSGALSQGWEAIRLGRALLVAKSLVDDPSRTWPREMLDYGALVLETIEDVLDAIPSGPPVPAEDLAF